MVDIVRRRNTRVESEDVSDIGKATAGIAKSIGGLADATSDFMIAQEKAEKKQYRADVSQNLKEAQTRMADEQKAFDASDKIVAADMAGRLKNDLLRWNMEQRQNNPNFIGTAEHEKRMRDEYARLANKYGAGLGEAGRAEFTSKTQNAVNEFIGNDVKWAYQQKLKKGEESAKQIAETMNQNAGMYGANGDVEGFKQAHEEDRQALKDYVGDVAPKGSKPALYEADKNSVIDFLMGMAETDPEKARAIMDNPELFKQVVPETMLQNVNDIMRDTKTRDLNDKLTLVNFDLARGVSDKQKKKLEKLKKDIEKEQKKVDSTDYTDSSLASIKDEVSQSVNKTIDYNLNLLKEEQKKQQNQQKIENSLAFMDNPIIYRANMERGSSKLPLYTKNEDINKKIEEKANEIYSLSDKVGDGKIDPFTLQMLVTKVASITVDNENPSIVDDNIMKAYDANIALRKAGADSGQITLFNQLTEKAMTDTNFKQSVAALANKPNFDTMFLSGRKPGLPFSYKTADTMYVEKLGRDAYINAIQIILSAETPEEQAQAKSRAMAYYDSKVQEAYDYIKKDVIDVDYVKRELAKTGSAMVELNGNMTKIVGRLPNGEYIIEDTGETINGGI